LRDDIRESSFRERQALLDRLPAFYRENPALVEPAASIAGEMLAAARRDLRASEEWLNREGAEAPGILEAWLAERGGAALASGGGDPLLGTPIALLRWLADAHGVLPEVWSGVEARPHHLGGVEIACARRPSVVLAWEKDLLPEPPPGFTIPDALLPAATRVQAISRSKPAHEGIPHRGEKVAGEIFWTRGLR